MKKFFLLVAFIAITLAVKAQDVIVLRNATEVQAKVEAIGQNEISYRKWNHLEGPIYTMAKSEIFFVKYANGEKESFLEYKTTFLQDKKVRMPKKTFEEDFYNAKFQGYSYLGADFNSGFGGPSLDFSFGARTSKHFYIGAGVGWHNLMGEIEVYNGNDYYYDYSYYTIWMPYLTFTADIKGYIPTRVKDFYPRLDLSFGGCAEFYNGSAGFYMSFGAGVDYRRFSFGIGYQMPVFYDEILPLGYVRLGIRFGK